MSYYTLHSFVAFVQSEAFLPVQLVYVIAWFAVVFGINSTSNAEIIVRGAAEYNLLHYECY